MLDHVGIAVRKIAEALPIWERQLGATGSPPEEVPGQQVSVSFLEVGATHLEFLEPRSDASAIARFLERRGEGLHHLAFEVPNVDSKLAALRAAGVPLVDEVSRIGARGRRIGFCRPEGFVGVLVEFVEPRR
jgi:methylmalonyl-CoA epimerase